MLRRHGPRDEEGAATSALLVTALLMALAAFMYIALPFGNASDAKAGSRTAADAAALAGAEQVKSDLLQAIQDDGWRGGAWWDEIPAGADLGMTHAADFASRNDGTLTAYNFSVLAGEASVTVEGRAIDGEPARSKAVAQVVWPNCQAPEEPEDPPFDEDQVGCNGFWLHFQPIEVNGEIRYTLTGQAIGLLRNAMTVRLVG